MEGSVYAFSELTCTTTLAEARCISGKELEWVGLGNTKRVKAIDSINFNIDGMVVQEFSVFEVVVITPIWTVQCTACFRTNIHAMLFQVRVQVMWAYEFDLMKSCKRHSVLGNTTFTVANSLPMAWGKEIEEYC